MSYATLTKRELIAIIEEYKNSEIEKENNSLYSRIEKLVKHNNTLEDQVYSLKNRLEAINEANTERQNALVAMREILDNFVE